MYIANQGFYLMAFIICFGLMMSLLSKVKSNDQSAFTSNYWTASLVLINLATLGFFFSAWLGQSLLSLSSFLLIASVCTSALLFRSWNETVGKKLISVLAILLLIVAALLVEWRYKTPSFQRGLLAVCMLTLLNVWQLYEIRRFMRRDEAFQLRVLFIVELFQIIVRTIRVFAAQLLQEPALDNLFNEGLIGFTLRVMSLGLLILNFLVVNNYFQEKLWKEHLKRSSAIEDGMLLGLNALSFARDNETGNHIIRTQQYVRIIASRLKLMGCYRNELADDAIELMEKAAPLHDIGKIGIPDSILLKPGLLEDEEWRIMKTHALLGETLLTSAQTEQEYHSKVLDVAVCIAGGHHENWDGSGYPRGRKGEEIPLAARIMALADVYDALVSERIYKKNWSHEDAMADIVAQRGIRFDPLVVDAFLLEASQFQEISQHYRDN